MPMLYPLSPSKLEGVAEGRGRVFISYGLFSAILSTTNKFGVPDGTNFQFRNSAFMSAGSTRRTTGLPS